MTGCRTSSSMFRSGKTTIFKLFEEQDRLILIQYLKRRTLVQKALIINGIRFLISIYGIPKRKILYKFPYLSFVKHTLKKRVQIAGLSQPRFLLINIFIGYITKFKCSLVMNWAKKTGDGSWLTIHWNQSRLSTCTRKACFVHQYVSVVKVSRTPMLNIQQKRIFTTSTTRHLMYRSYNNLLLFSRENKKTMRRRRRTRRKQPLQVQLEHYQSDK